MKLSVKKFSKKSLSLLIALIMVFSALPLTPPISANAAETKTEILVWDASRATTDSNNDRDRYSYADSQTHKTLSGIQWHGLTHNSTYLTVNDSALSFAEINTKGVITGNDNIADKGIRGNKWSFSAKFAYTGSATKTTVFGLSSTTKRNYTQRNDGGGTGLDNGYVADLVDIRADGTVYINNNWNSTVSGISSADLVSTAPKTLTVTYDNGNLTIDIDGTQKISQPVDTTLFSAGVGNYLAGPNVQVFAGGTAPYYRVSNESAYLRNFNLYSLSGATYTNSQEYKNYIDRNINGFAMPTHQSVIYNGTDLSLSNVLYTSNTYLDNDLTNFSLNGKASDTGMTAKLVTVTDRIVYMYTGNNSIVKVPLIFEVGKGKNVSTLQRYRVNYICSASNSWNLDYNNWERTTANNWDTDPKGEEDGVYRVSSSSSHNVADYNDSNRGEGIGNTKDFRNIATFNGNLSFTNNYFKIGISELPSVDMSFDGISWWQTGSIFNKKDNYLYSNNITKDTSGLEYPLSTISLKNTASYSVIDFSGYNALVSNDTMKKKYKEVKDNETKYTDDSLLAYYEAVANLVKFKTSNYDLSTDSGVTSCARDLATVVNNYNKAERELAQKTVSVNFVDVTLAPKKTLNVKPGTTINENDLPSTTSPTYYRNNQHRVYYWAYPGDTEFTVPYTVNDNVDIYEKLRYEDCNFKVKSIDGNTSTVSCSVCNGGTYTLDIEGYNNIVSVAREAINDTVKYDSASRAYLQTVLNDNNTVNDCTTIEQVNAKISAIQTAINELDLNQYLITFNVVNEYGNSTETVINAQSCDYGTLLNLQLPDTYQENAVSAWKRNINGVDSVVGATSHSLQVMITGNATYTAFVKKATTASGGQAVITLNNKSNKVYDIGYVENNKVVDVNVDVKNGTITIGGKKLTAPTYSFYKVKGFQINGKTVNTGTINITGDIVIMPEYEAITPFEITGGNGVVEKSTRTSWDKRVKLTAQTPAQAGKINKWTSTINGKTVVWGYGDTLSFQATQACTVECTEVDVTEFDGFDDVSLSVDYVSYNLYRSNSITAISRVVAPEGIVEEYGTILKTANVKSGVTNDNYETQKAAVNNKDNYKVTNKSGVFKSTQMISNTNQFAYNFYSAQNYDKMYVGAVAYAKLTNGSYVYSDVVTYEFIR